MAEGSSSGPYTFPTERLSTLSAAESARTPLVLVTCGSFSPITHLHLRMFEMARDHARDAGQFIVVGGYFSPVASSYAKAGLAPALNRVEMCELATRETSDWLAVDRWEALEQGGAYTPTAQVLDHFDQKLNGEYGGADMEVLDGETGDIRIEKRRIRIMLLAGSDLILTMSDNNLWPEKDLHHILLFGLYIIERSGSDIDRSVFNSSSIHSRSPLALYRDNIHFVEQLVRNDISSTRIRMLLRKRLSVRYLTPTSVLDYIAVQGLYTQPDRREASSRRNSPALEERPRLGV